MDMGRYGEGIKLQSPVPYLLSSPRAQTLAAAHQPAPALSCSQGCLLHPSAVCMEQVPSWESHCWVRARVQVCSWALDQKYRSSLRGCVLQLPDCPCIATAAAPFGLVVSTTPEVMGL